MKKYGIQGLRVKKQSMLLGVFFVCVFRGVCLFALREKEKTGEEIVCVGVLVSVEKY